MEDALYSLRDAFLAGLQIEWLDVQCDIEADSSDGAEIAIESWQDSLCELRLESLGKPGVYLDRSPTGAGKSTADIEAIRAAGRALVVLPTHDQCEEAEENFCEAELDAVAYRGRFTDGEEQNCWNEEADEAEELGFSPATAVCHYCEHRAKCSLVGYVAQTEEARNATVSIATQNRAIYTGLESLAKGRSYIAIHEDVFSTLVSSTRISLGQLRRASDILDRILNDPQWLNRLGDVWDVDESGNRIKNESKSQRRAKVYEFAMSLLDLVERLIEDVSSASVSREVLVDFTTGKPAGIERLLFQAACDFGRTGPWRSLLAIATGKTHRTGVLVREKNKPPFHHRPKPAPSQRDDMAR